MKVKVDIDNIPEKYRSLVKPEMTREELALFGTVILKDKIANFKYRLRKNIIWVFSGILCVVTTIIAFITNTSGFFAFSIFLWGVFFIMKLAERSVRNEKEKNSS